MLPAEFAINQKISHPTYGNGQVTVLDTVAQRIKFKFPNEKYELVFNFYLPSGEVCPFLLAITLFVKTRSERNAALEQKALETAQADGFALHQDRNSCVWIEAAHPLFSELVTLVLELGPTLVMVAPTAMAETLSVDMGNFVIPVSEKSHQLKCNISVPNCKRLGDLQKAMKFNVHTNGWTNGFGEVVLYSRDLAKALGDAGFISERFLKKPFVEDEVI